MLSNRITDYPLISQGKTRIPGVNDAEELEVTVVSRAKAWSVRVASDIRVMSMQPTIWQTHHLPAPCKSSEGLSAQVLSTEPRFGTRTYTN